MKYELRYDGIVEQSDDYDVLKKKALLLQSEYVIYRVLTSKMNDIPAIEEDELLVIEIVRKETVASGALRKMSERQVKQAIIEIERGYSKVSLSRKYKVSDTTLSKYISEYENKHQ